MGALFRKILVDSLTSSVVRVSWTALEKTRRKEGVDDS
jgi:hypothetical protein